LRERRYRQGSREFEVSEHVRYGSKADIGHGISYVRFEPETGSGRRLRALQIRHDGQIISILFIRIMSSRGVKNIALPFFGILWLVERIPPRQGGAYRDRHDT
jgi:hypothetical protein